MIPVPIAKQRRLANPRMTAVGAILRYSHIEPTFENSSHGRPPSRKPTASLPAEDCTLFIVLPNNHIWAPHTKQRAVFEKSSQSRASTTVVVEHHCPKGCPRHPPFVDGLHVPLLRRVQESPGSQRLRSRSWQQLTARSSQAFSRRLSRLIQRVPQEVPDTEAASVPIPEQYLDSSEQDALSLRLEKQRRTLDRQAASRTGGEATRCLERRGYS